MKSISIALTLAISLTALHTALARLGDSEDALIQRYGKPRAIEATTGDTPTQKGFYAELKENFTTNVSLIASTDTNYNAIGYGMDLVETRTRYKFEKDGLRVTAYLGNSDEKYNGVDFAGKSAREVIYSSSIWEKNKVGDKVAHPLPFSAATIASTLENNKGDSTWSDGWQLGPTPGIYIKHSADKARMAIAYGPSEKEIYRLELRMIDPNKATD
jgi:hypothetical protein